MTASRPATRAAATCCAGCCAARCARCGCSATRTVRCPSCSRSAATRWARPTPSWTATGSASRRWPTPRRTPSGRRCAPAPRIFDTAASQVQSVGRHPAPRRPGVRAARHLRLPDRPDPGDGRGEGPLGRRGRLPPADERAARARPRRREVQEGPAQPTPAPTARSPTRLGRRGRVHRLRRGRQRGRGPRHRRRRRRASSRRARATRSSWCSTARRSTPRAAASSPTRASSSSSNGARLEVYDVQSPISGLIVHKARVLAGEVTRRRPRAGRSSTSSAAASISRSHTATHMVHKAFREALGRDRDPGRVGELTGSLPLRLLRRRRGARSPRCTTSRRGSTTS